MMYINQYLHPQSIWYYFFSEFWSNDPTASIQTNHKCVQNYRLSWPVKFTKHLIRKENDSPMLLKALYYLCPGVCLQPKLPAQSSAPLQTQTTSPHLQAYHRPTALLHIYSIIKLALIKERSDNLWNHIGKKTVYYWLCQWGTCFML